MFLVAFVALALLSVPLTGGRLGALAHVRFRGVGLLAGALAVQVGIISFVAGGPSWLHPASDPGEPSTVERISPAALTERMLHAQRKGAPA